MTVTNRQPTASTRRRVSAAALALAAVYVISGLLGNLHLVLVDHHGTLAHDHHHHHHATGCPDAEWTPAAGCDDHHELADHDVVSANTTRGHKTVQTAAILPAEIGDDVRDDGDRTASAFLVRAYLESIASSAPIRAPPVSLHSV